MPESLSKAPPPKPVSNVVAPLPGSPPPTPPPTPGAAPVGPPAVDLPPVPDEGVSGPVLTEGLNPVGFDPTGHASTETVVETLRSEFAAKLDILQAQVDALKGANRG